MAGHHQNGQELNWKLSLDFFLTREEIGRLRSWAKNRRNRHPKDRIAWNEWFLIELAINTGLRVFEITDLECRDIVLRRELSFINVRNGKCRKSRQVRVSTKFQESALEFLEWKRQKAEETKINSPLFFSPKSKAKYTTRGLQLAFKRCIKRAGIPDYHSIHHLRHSYASCLWVSSKKDIRLVQKQLGHSSISITQVYVDLFEENIKTAIERLL
jgi:site-specific recombinase XerD